MADPDWTKPIEAVNDETGKRVDMEVYPDVVTTTGTIVAKGAAPWMVWRLSDGRSWWNPYSPWRIRNKQPSPAWPEGLVERAIDLLRKASTGHVGWFDEVRELVAEYDAAMQPVDPLDDCEAAALKYVRDCGGDEKEILGAEAAIRQFRRELAKRGLQLAETTDTGEQS